MIRKTIYFAGDMLLRILRICREQKIDFSKIIQKAGGRLIADTEKARLERALAQGYKTKAQLNLLIAKDFEGLDGETI
jgi:hypothetical protein